jgi:tRNA 5-methylaminomethyl-2-thiouridine biosynthesis bifunctional protein
MIEQAIVDWDETGTPRSRRFDDIYFSRGGGLDETRTVFLQGCGLPEAWRGRRRFVVGELGFGTGLNVLALLQLWQAAREPGARLHIFSVEAFPLDEADARRALAAWPELEPLAEILLAGWPAARGFHRIDFPGQGAVLDLAVMEAAEALEAWRGRADAWFLDGFSPSRNPEIWRDEVLALAAARSAQGARAASFTVAGTVRRGLEAQGFETAKRPGFGGKAERLEASLPGPIAHERRALPTVCIVGAGIAGAALARAFRAEGVEPVVLDARAPGAGASGNPAALVTPRLDAGGGTPAQLHAQAFARAVALYGQTLAEAVISRGALQLEIQPRDAPRFDRLAESDLFPEGALQRLNPAETGARLGEPADTGALWIRDALVLEPGPVLGGWLGPGGARTAAAAGLEPVRDGWRLLGQAGEALAEAEVVCIATGHAAGRLAPVAIEPVRGQASFAPWPERPTPAAWGGYVIPTRDGLLFGATHERGQDGAELRAGDHLHNLEVLARKRPRLAAALTAAPLDGRAAVRASTRDRLPAAGGLAGMPGVFVLTGLGGRGFCLAPLLAEHVAALALRLPSPLPRPLAEAVDPDRDGVRRLITPG